MLENQNNQNLLVFLLVFFGLLFFFFKIDFIITLGLIPIELKYDTFLGIIGNFIIAVYIASVISKKQKNNELKIDNCFKELDHLLCLISELRNFINEKKEDELEDIKIRYSSLISLQIELIKKYNFISEEYKYKLDEHYRGLDKSLTGESDINYENYKYSSLQIEKTILNIKSNIL